MSLQLIVVQFMIASLRLVHGSGLSESSLATSNWLPLRRRDGNSASLFNCQWNQGRRFSSLLARHQP